MHLPDDRILDKLYEIKDFLKPNFVTLYITMYTNNDIVFSNYIAEKTGKGIKFKIIAITDHDTIEGGLVAKDYYDDMHGDNELEIIIGAELTSANGHIVALNLKENIPPKLSAQETIDAIHEQGGIAIAAHPYSYLPFLKEFKGVGKLIYDEVVGKKFDAVEIRNSNPTETINNHITEIRDLYHKIRFN